MHLSPIQTILLFLFGSLSSLLFSCYVNLLHEYFEVPLVKHRQYHKSLYSCVSQELGTTKLAEIDIDYGLDPI